MCVQARCLVAAVEAQASDGDGHLNPATRRHGASWVLEVVGFPHSAAVRVLMVGARLLGVEARLDPAGDAYTKVLQTHPCGAGPCGRLATSWDACAQRAWLSGMPALVLALDTCGSSRRPAPRLDGQGDPDPGRAVLLAQWWWVLLVDVAPVVDVAVALASASTDGLGVLEGTRQGAALVSCLHMLEQLLAPAVHGGGGATLLCSAGDGRYGASWVDLLLAVLLTDIARVTGGASLLVGQCPRLASWLPFVLMVWTPLGMHVRIPKRGTSDGPEQIAVEAEESIAQGPCWRGMRKRNPATASSETAPARDALTLLQWVREVRFVGCRDCPQRGWYLSAVVLWLALPPHGLYLTRAFLLQLDACSCVVFCILSWHVQRTILFCEAPVVDVSCCTGCVAVVVVLAAVGGTFVQRNKGPLILPVLVVVLVVACAPAVVACCSAWRVRADGFPHSGWRCASLPSSRKAPQRRVPFGACVLGGLGLFAWIVAYAPFYVGFTQLVGASVSDHPDSMAPWWGFVGFWLVASSSLLACAGCSMMCCGFMPVATQWCRPRRCRRTPRRRMLRIVSACMAITVGLASMPVLLMLRQFAAVAGASCVMVMGVGLVGYLCRVDARDRESNHARAPYRWEDAMCLPQPGADPVSQC
jgi:hypothetical protein